MRKVRESRSSELLSHRQVRRELRVAAVDPRQQEVIQRGTQENVSGAVLFLGALVAFVLMLVLPPSGEQSPDGWTAAAVGVPMAASVFSRRGHATQRGRVQLRIPQHWTDGPRGVMW